MIEEITDQTWWIMEQLLTDWSEEFVAIYKKVPECFFALLEKENTKFYLSSVYNYENMTIAHGQT